MNLIYGVDKYFIGAVEFFDASKDFGFIASNNCNMPTSRYEQDFYVSSTGFLEENAKKEGRIVVFQVSKQENDKKRAVNVRCITTSDADTLLALSYYGDHEFIEFKKFKINLFKHIFKPIGVVADKVMHIIEEDVERSPQKTAEHFKFFVEHYKQEEYSKNRYIFDRQFSTDEKSVWQSLLSIFTDDERLAILKMYPSIVRYFNNKIFILKWIEQKLNNDSEFSDWQEFETVFDYIPKECIDFAKQRIETLVDGKIKKEFNELATRSDLSEDDFKLLREYKPGMAFDMYANDSKAYAIYKLRTYLRLTSKKYEEEKANCLVSVKRNRFKKELSAFIGKQNNSYERDKFFNYLNNLSPENLHMFRDELVTSISPVIDNSIYEKKYWQVVSDIKQLSIIGENYFIPYKQRLLPLIKETLKDLLITHLNSPYEIKSTFFSAYEHYTSIYGNTEKKELERELIPIMKETHSIAVLSEMSTGFHEWFPVNEALALAKDIVSHWNYKNIKEFVKDEPDLFDNNILFADLIISRANELIGNVNLTHFFDGTPLKKRANKYNSHFPERENCRFLNDLKKLIPEDQHSSEWDKYINSRSVEDLLILFENDIIISLPENIVEIIVNSISSDEISADKELWYSKPSLKNRTYAKILETTNVNLFPIIAHRLQSMPMTDENIALVVLLTELMIANMPGNDSDYYTRKNWESNFTSQIQGFRRTNSINQRLSVIWWAVHSKTTTSSASLTEVFAFLPPYLQIKIVKKLFKSISEGKIHHTAESLYNLIANGDKTICFPLEMTFTYLKLREKDPSKTLNNTIMLQLLEGREDTDEWIRIRTLITQCSGRWIPDKQPDDRTKWKSNSYFNGIISKLQNGKIRVFIPRKMVDEYGNTKDYNNKYYAHVVQLIQITYKKKEFQVINEQNGISYYFDEVYKLELFAIARSFNFKYTGWDNFLEFITEKEEQEEFCECRLSDKEDNRYGIPFYWCGNKPCFRPPVRYHIDSEWEYYTILDFMRILDISPDYINKNGKCTKFGHYIILLSYLKSFAKFYKHLKCRECGKLMKPLDITNFTSRAVTEFSCTNESCKMKGDIVYLNHCFNKQKCNAIIDSRDSKQCPNGQYICPECGACCSTENFRLRINHLHMTGGYISDRLKSFVDNDLGHWEKSLYFCYKCGTAMQLQSDGHYVCPNCDTKYEHR